MLPKFYGSENTIKLYKEPGLRLQLVKVSNDLDSVLEVRENRKILLRTYYFDEAAGFFRSRVYSYVSQLSLC